MRSPGWRTGGGHSNSGIWRWSCRWIEVAGLRDDLLSALRRMGGLLPVQRAVLRAGLKGHVRGRRTSRG